MALQTSDKFMIDRGGTLYRVTASDIVVLVQSLVGTSAYEVANIAARNALTGLSIGDRVFVIDATGDATVSSGWAIYVYRGPSTWTKVAESEGMDLIVGANLSYTPAPTQGTVVSSTGDDATLPAVDGTNAGLMLPSHKAKLDHLTVTQAVDLDAVEAAAHAAVTLAGSATTNPLTLTGQQLGFSIGNLSAAP